MAIGSHGSQSIGAVSEMDVEQGEGIQVRALGRSGRRVGDSGQVQHEEGGQWWGPGESNVEDLRGGANGM